MSMWISRVEQLEEGRGLFGELVWAFMNEIWPSTVSLVIPKGGHEIVVGNGDLLFERNVFVYQIKIHQEHVL